MSQYNTFFFLPVVFGGGETSEDIYIYIYTSTHHCIRRVCALGTVFVCVWCAQAYICIHPEKVSRMSCAFCVIRSLTCLFPSLPLFCRVSPYKLVQDAPSGGAAAGDQEEAGAARRQQQQLRLQHLEAIVSILSIWESEALEEAKTTATAATATAAAETSPNNADAALPLPAVEKVRRLRAEVSVKALVDATDMHAQTRPIIGGSVIHDGRGHHPEVGTLEDDDEAMASATWGGAIVALMQEWWPKLISAAVDTGEWDFLCK